MKSYVFRESGAPLVEVETPDPVPGGTEVLMEVRHCGVCHTDVHLRQGWFDLGGGKRLASKLTLPHVLGHEIEGAVVASGPAAGPLAAGARYAVFPWIGCGRCRACLRGEENVCLGETRQLGCSSACPGGYATHVLVPHPRYLLDLAGLGPRDYRLHPAVLVLDAQQGAAVQDWPSTIGNDRCRLLGDR